MGVKVRQKVKGTGNPWWVFVSHNGKRMSRSIGSKKAAEKAAREIEAQLGLGKFDLEKPQEIPTFGEYADKWLKFVESQTKGNDANYKKSTIIEYECVLRLHILPVFKDMNIDKITNIDIRDFLISKFSTLSKKRVESITTVMSNIFELAVDDGIVGVNPTTREKRRLFKKNGTKKEIEKTEVFDLDEIKLFLDTCNEYYPNFYVFFLTAVRTGMRLGELLALEWDDIDFNSKYIWVRRSYRRGRTTNTKTKQTRQTDMSDQLVVALKDHLRVCKEDALKQGRGEVTGLIFDYGMANRERYIQRQYKHILMKAGLRYVKFHGLRHAFCAHLLSAGVSPYYVSQQVGHSSIAITCDVYGTWISSKETRHVNALDSMHQNDPYTHPKTNGKLQLIENTVRKEVLCQ